MIVGLFLLAIVLFLSVVTHRQTRLEKKLLKNIPIADWITITILPLFVLLAGWMFITSIVARPSAAITPFEDLDLIGMTVFFIIFGFIGVTLHFTSKVLWRYIPKREARTAYKINEMFHNRISHYVIYVSASLAVFLLTILEINHPVASGMSQSTMLTVIFAGILSGWSYGRSIFYVNQWFGGYNRPFFILIFIFAFLQKEIFAGFKLSFENYPLSLMVMLNWLTFLGVFIIRQLLIFTRLNNKHKLRYIMKIFSV